MQAGPRFHLPEPARQHHRSDATGLDSTPGRVIFGLSCLRVEELSGFRFWGLGFRAFWV